MKLNKSFGLVMAIAVAALCCVSSQARPPRGHHHDRGKHPAYVYSTAPDGILNVRTAPSPDAGLLGYLVTGGRGAIFMGKAENGWDKVNFYGQIGYVSDRQSELGPPNKFGLKPHPDHGREYLNDNSRTIYYIVCGSYNSKQQAIAASQQMSEVVFYDVYEVREKGATKYRLSCFCSFSKAEAQRELKKFKRNFGGKDWWIWPSAGMAKCVYIAPSPAADENVAVDHPLAPAN